MARSISGSSGDSIKASGVYSVLTDLTASCWVYITSLTPAYSTMFWSSGSFLASSNFSIYVKSNGKLAMYYNTSAASYDGSGTNTLSTNTWYNLIFLGTSTTPVTGYVNGSLDGTGGANFANATTGEVWAGLDSTGNFGDIVSEDYAIWNTALSSMEISALAKGERPNGIRPGSLIAWWPYNGLQSPEPDLSGQAHNGVLTGTSLAFGAPLTMFKPRRQQFIEPPPTAFAANRFMLAA